MNPIAKQFKIRCSAIGQIMAGSIGLTTNQQAEFDDFVKREKGEGRPLTDKMVEKLADYRHKIANPELPDGAKTYCKKWLKEHLYKRRYDIKSKYIAKGHETEEAGFTMMAVHCRLGMVYKNEVFKENDWITGTCDIDHEALDTVFDNKSSWSLDTFPMFESEIPDKGYEMQVQGYMSLYGRHHGAVVYTLTDTPISILRNELRWITDDNERQRAAMNHVYSLKAWEETKKELFPLADDKTFVEIPEAKRVKRFDFDYDAAFIGDVQERVELCRKYINTLL